ncbi:MAG: DMT family transporter [Deferrisomatales bacterium]|nr:DMT family transporter [Deferrisomatales bacterium]
MTHLFLFLLMLCVGAVAALQPLVNARLAQRVGGFLPSALVSFSVGALVLATLVLGSGRSPGLRGLAGASWWELTGGLMGALYVSSTIIVYPRIGAAAALAAVIAAQLTAGLLLDHFGAFGFRQIALDWQRVLGVVLLFVGAVLVFRS